MNTRILLAALLLASLPVWGKPTAETTDPLALAALMLSDQHPERALDVLQSAETLQKLDKKQLDAARYYTLLGLAYKARQIWPKAWDALQQAVQLGNKNPNLHVHLARIAWALQRHDAVIDEVEQSGPLLQRLPGLHLLKIRSQWQLGQQQAAWKSLQQALQQFPQEAMLYRQQIDLLLELKLYAQAAEKGRAFIQQGLGKREDWLAIANALRMSHHYSLALQLLEQARLAQPDDSRITRLLARTWMDAGHPVAAADLLYRQWLNSGARDQALLAETTELYRRAGRLHQALRLSSQITDEVVKTRQRMALYLQLEQFDKLLNSEAQLERLRLLDDENLRYTLAYAAFRMGRFQRMEKHLQFIKNPDLFRKAAALRKAASECADKAWQCIG